MKKSFVISTRYHQDLTMRIKINVYPDRENFIKGTGDEEALGLCQRYWTEDEKGNKILENRQVATISLIEGYLGSGYVSHESAHAAIHIWGLMNDDALDDTNDEPFAWILGDVVRKIYIGLYRLKIL